MAGQGQGGLGSRVARRTFLVFGLSALLPVIVFGVLGYLAVSRELEASAQERLAAAAKRYGILLNERLIQAETLMLEVARLHLESGRSLDQGSAALLRLQTLTDLSGDGVQEAIARTVPVTETPLPAGWQATRLLQADASGGSPQVRLVMNLVDARGRGLRLISDPTGLAFWNAETVALTEGRMCVLLRGRPLNCEANDFPGEDGSAVQSARWTLFLRPRYGTEEWTIVAEQPRRIALQALGSFRVFMPLAAALAIAIALLLSARHVRRSHQPLAVLAAAARRISRGRFGEPVRLTSDDEYGALARAFNHMRSRLRRQFGLVATLARLDRQILARPTFEPVVRALLPRMPRILGCEAAAVLAVPGETDGPALLLFRRGGDGTTETPPLADAAGLVGALAAAAADPVRKRGLIASVPALARAVAPDGHWDVQPIRVAGTVRGVLLTAFGEERTARAARRQAAGFARRLAVALGNEDRERALVRQAYYDGLTGLPNRQLFRDRLVQELVRSGRDGGLVSLLFVDLDQFKNVNDSLGHSAGDALLCRVAERLRGEMREGDTLSRLGGDEFTVICPGATPEQAAAIAARLQAALLAPLSLAGRQHVVQASIGIAVYPTDCADAEDLLRCADAAMYRAKQSGRGRVAFFEEGMNARARRRMQLEQRLRLALVEGGLRLVYQPKVHAAGGGLDGFEALCRWEDAELGVVAPPEFIAIAEETGLIGQLGEWALDEACRQVREWLDAGMDAQHVAVNVSVHQLRDADFPAMVRGCLARHRLPAHAIELEITESSLAEEGGKVVERIAELRESGLRTAMDDFGTGYSSLAALRALPVDVMKVDRSFITRSTEAAADEALLRALIELAHTLDKRVVAEGVETPQQLELLRDLGCDVAQGYLVSKPLPPASVPAFVHALRELGRPAA